MARIFPVGLSGGTRGGRVACIPGQNTFEVRKDRDLSRINGARVGTVAGGEVPGRPGDLAAAAGGLLLFTTTAVGLRAIGGHRVDGARPSGPTGLAAEAGNIIPLALYLVLGGRGQRQQDAEEGVAPGTTGETRRTGSGWVRRHRAVACANAVGTHPGVDAHTLRSPGLVAKRGEPRKRGSSPHPSPR